MMIWPHLDHANNQNPKYWWYKDSYLEGLKMSGFPWFCPIHGKTSLKAEEIPRVCQGELSDIRILGRTHYQFNQKLYSQNERSATVWTISWVLRDSSDAHHLLIPVIKLGICEGKKSTRGVGNSLLIRGKVGDKSAAPGGFLVQRGRFLVVQKFISFE